VRFSRASDRRSDNDGVDIGLADHFAVIEKTVAFEFLGVLPFALLIDVAHSDDLAVFGALADSGKYPRQV